MPASRDAARRPRKGRQLQAGHRAPRRDDEQRTSTATGPLASAFREGLPFKPDVFQEEALAALESGHSVLVTAPTGAGKTLIADFAAYMAVDQGYGLIYTTPIKALSNQKYRQLCTQFGRERVGLVTGDTVINRTAPLLVMTTEIVRNLLLLDPAALRGVGYLVFDEVHFLADAERGPVWEEAIIWAPPETRLVCLSATVSNAREIARWLDAVHGPTRADHARRAPRAAGRLPVPGQRIDPRA